MKRKIREQTYEKNKRKIYANLIMVIIVLIICFSWILSLPISKAASFTLTSRVNLNAANGKGGIDLDWSSLDQKNKTFMLYQQKEGSNEWQSISTVDFYSNMQPIKVLNVYPTHSPTSAGEIKRVTFNYKNGPQNVNLNKSASLKVWMEGGTMVEDGVVTNYEAYGRNPKTGQQLIYVTPMNAQEFNAHPENVWNYDIVMFGTWDGNGTTPDQPSEHAVNVIEEYIKKGYGVLCGHDTIGCAYGLTGLSRLKSYFGIITGYWSTSQPGNIQGVDYQESWGYRSNRVKVTRQGLLTNFPWELPLGSIQTVPIAHTCANASVSDTWMEFSNGDWWGGPYAHEGNGNAKYYLTTKNNTAMIQTGHSNCESTEDERKILANTLFYLKQRTTSTSFTDNSSQDVAAPNAPNARVKGYDSSGNINIATHSDDNGSRYSFYAEAHQADNYEKLIKSNITSHTVTTGVTGYYYIVDNNASNNFNISNARIYKY